MLAHGRAESLASATAIAGIMKLVGLPTDPGFQRRYPHQLSGGQQQRVCIAMALACDPDLLVLDEPTTGLDVTTQEQIISLLSELRVRIGVAMLYVTHDLALLSQIADRIGVMYAGRMVEIAPTDEIFLRPRHPYTQGLIASIPLIEDLSVPRARPLRGLLRRRELPPGCPFAPRCDHALERCVAERQELETIDDVRAVACWRWREIAPVPAEPASSGRRRHAGRARAGPVGRPCERGLRPQIARLPRGQRRLVRDQGRRGVRPGRRIRQREIDAGAGDQRPDGAGRRHHQASRREAG